MAGHTRAEGTPTGDVESRQIEYRIFLSVFYLGGGGGQNFWMGGFPTAPAPLPPQGRQLWGTLGLRRRRWSMHFACGKAFCPRWLGGQG